MSTDLSNWTPRPVPERKTMEGRFVRLEPLDPARHGDGLFEVSTVPDADARFRFLGNDYPPRSREAFEPWLQGLAASGDPICFVVLDAESGRVLGRQNFMRIDRPNGVIEIGSIYWGPQISRTPGATDALYLFARHAFDDLGYRRFEWKCDDLNVPSKSAALRFGFSFEGLFRQHMVLKGQNRDTAWFSMIDGEWPRLRHAFEEWLDPSNFDREGRQKRRLVEIRDSIAAGQD
jgi:RimJ/RimL family protein N-acetyltransferase